MPARSPARSRFALLACLLATGMLGGCEPERDEAAAEAPSVQLAGMLIDPKLGETSGLASSTRHRDVLWVHNDGGEGRLFATSTSGGRIATFRIEDVTRTDWEDIAAFELDGRRYLLIADTGDNGGLRRTLQLHVVEEPSELRNARLTPAWSIVFRWPDGPRDCEAVAVDAARGQILLVSKKRSPPELFSLPLRPPGTSVLTAAPVATLTGMPIADAQRLRDSPRRARMDAHVTAAAVSPDGSTLAVMTYRYLLLYPRMPQERWAAAVSRAPRVSDLPWLPQAEALDFSSDGRSLYATGEFVPAPLYRITP
ncbi:MAG: hypothetical protein M3Q11_08405 [Pseudomonadota bacterium]|nr:hypothetical protein [Pseudomonadota bacterium]